MPDLTTATWHPPEASQRAEAGDPALAIVGCVHAPDRIGEVAFLPTPAEGPAMVGRHGTLRWIRHRPGQRQPTGALADRQLSRVQLEICPDGRGHTVRNRGRLPLKINGGPAGDVSFTLQDGDLLQLGDRVLLLALRRPRVLVGSVDPEHAFGRADAQGWVGESAASWRIRKRIQFVARRNAHVLVLGESGSGKELAALALHRLSRRGGRPLISRNASTIPEGIADAELFGNLANYPNPSTPARPGLIGEADGSALFLDEFGELPLELQARLLRVLDAGEYTRLGEARPRRADLRLIAATNRDPSTLKHDVLARLQLQLEIPGLRQRIEDVPLIAAHLLRSIARDDPELARQLFPDGDLEGHPSMSMSLLTALLTHPYTTHVRELEALLWQAISAAEGHLLDLPPAGMVVARSPTPTALSGPVDPASLDPVYVQKVLDRHGGRQEPAWRELGMSSRHVLARFVRKHELRVRGRRRPEDSEE